MNTDTISRLRALLAGYYAGETSESDERELHRLLGDASLPAEFEADRRMISAMSLFAPSDGFEKRLSDKIDQMATVASGGSFACRRRGCRCDALLPPAAVWQRPHSRRGLSTDRICLGGLCRCPQQRLRRNQAGRRFCGRWGSEGACLHWYHCGWKRYSGKR